MPIVATTCGNRVSSQQFAKSCGGTRRPNNVALNILIQQMGGAEKWRYFAWNKLDCFGFKKSALAELRNDPQFSFGDQDLRVLQDSLQNALPGWLKSCKAAGYSRINEEARR